MSNTPKKQPLGIDTDKKVLKRIKAIHHQHLHGNCKNSYPVANVKIPNTVFTNCPLVRNAVIAASECKGCINFKGVMQVAWDDEQVIPWAEKYVIYCAKPIERKCFSLVTTVNLG